jgi:hypothetical protein
LRNLIFLTVFLFGLFANAQSVNLLLNQGFESRKSGWSASAGSFTIESASPLVGKYSGSWDSSASSQTLSSSLYTIEKGMVGRRCSASLVYKWPSGVASDLSFQVVDQTPTVIATVDLVPTSGDDTRQTILWFDCGALAAQKRVLLLSNVSNPALILIDNAFLGSDGNLTTEKPQDVFSAKISSADAVSDENVDFINGNCTDASVGDATCVFNSGIFTSTPTCVCAAQQVSNTGACKVTNTSASQVSFRTVDDAGSSANRAFNVTCQKVESAANREALTLETTGSSWSGYHDSTCSWPRTNTAFGDPTADASCSLVERFNSGFGSVVTYGAALPGITFTPKNVGTYRICALAAFINDGAGTASRFNLTDGTNDFVTAIQGNGASYTNQVSLCANVPVTSLASKSIRVQTASATNTVTIQGANTGAIVHAVEWTIYPVTQQFPAPVFTELQNLMKGGPSGNYKTVTAFITNSGTPTVSRQDGAWISSLTDNGLGDVTINLVGGIFSGAPNCFCMTSSVTPALSGCRNDNATAVSSSAVRIETTLTTTAAQTDTDFFVSCTGPQ